jgi:hypothetical protein
MKIEILDIAMRDIQSGQRFYELQQEGLGDYFLDSIFSDIVRYCFLAESTNSSSAILERFQRDSHTQFTIEFQIKPFKFGGC